MIIIQGIIAGLFAGFICGLFGMGGGSLLVPVIVHIFDLPIKTAIGTSLFIIVFSAFSALFKYTKSQKIDKQLLFLIVPAGIAGAQAGALLTSRLPEVAVKYIFVILVASLGLKMLFHPENKPEDEAKPTENLTAKALAIGLFAGFISGLCGVGGAVLIIPLMYIFLKVPIHTCIGTSLVAILFNSLSGSAGYIARGLVDMRTGLVLAIGSTLGAPLGAKISINISREKLRRAFAIILILSSLSVLLKFENEPSPEDLPEPETEIAHHL